MSRSSSSRAASIFVSETTDKLEPSSTTTSSRGKSTSTRTIQNDYQLHVDQREEAATLRDASQRTRPDDLSVLDDVIESITTEGVIEAVMGKEPAEVKKMREEELRRKNAPPPPPPPPTPLTPNTLVEVLTADVTLGAKEVKEDIESMLGADPNKAVGDDSPGLITDTMVQMGIMDPAPVAKPKTYLDRAEGLFAQDGLNYKRRIIGCGSCMVLGYLLSFGSVFRINALLKGNPIPFILTATLGNIIALCGSCFLSGPRAQTKNMFKKRRRFASCAYLGSLFLTIAVAFRFGMNGQKQVLIVLIACQYLSIAAYCLSYVPFIEEIIQVLHLKAKKLLKKGKYSENVDEDEDEDEAEMPDFRMMV